MRRSGCKIMTKLIVLVKPMTGYMLAAILMGLVGHLCASFITIFGSLGILEILGYDSSFSMKMLFGCMIFFAILRAVMRYVEQTCNHYSAFKILALLRDKLFQAMRKLAPAKLEGKDKGNLIAMITSDVELLEVFYAHTISPIAIAALFSICMMMFIGNVHWSLGIIAFVAYAVVGIVIPLAAAKITGDAGETFRRDSGELSSFILENLRGLDEILQYGQGEHRLNRMQEKTKELLCSEEKMKRIMGLNQAVTNMVVLIFDVAMLLAGSYLWQQGSIGFDGVLAATIALFSSFGPVIALANLGSTLQNTFAAGNRILDILEESPLIHDITGQEEVEFSGAEVKNVHFSYEDEQILSDISLQIPENSIIGIVGKSGSGKSTLLKLLMRFWQTGSGSVEISGQNVETVNTENLRNMQSFVTQETHLFHDSIRNNLRIAKLDATDVEIEAACKKASVHEFICSLPNGYDTQVGELGDTLSGGERQRLGLARAFLHDAPMMLLDEPTSNLDSLNEAVILRALQQERKDKTVVLVSHRASTMRVADQIYSVEYGRVS